MIKEDVSTRVEEIRVFREMRPSTLAKLAGLTMPTLGKIRDGTNGVTKNSASGLAKALRVDIGTLYAEVGAPIVQAGGDDTPAPTKSTDINELNVASQGGAGLDEMPMDGNGNHQVVAQWRIPTNYLLSYTASAEGVRIIRVAGDSMEPDYPAGERVMVDTSHRVPSPPGVYVLWDGFGLILKRLEYLYGSKPPVVRIKSINPNYETYEKPLDEVIINGRVIGKWTWK